MAAQGIAQRLSLLANDPSVPLHLTTLALGSDLGDRVAHIKTALQLLEVPSPSINKLTRPSPLTPYLSPLPFIRPDGNGWPLVHPSDGMTIRARLLVRFNPMSISI